MDTGPVELVSLVIGVGGFYLVIEVAQVDAAIVDPDIGPPLLVALIPYDTFILRATADPVPLIRIVLRSGDVAKVLTSVIDDLMLEMTVLIAMINVLIWKRF